ncbi:MAG: lipopolysaccharide heptosyltransferase I [Lautropia sp.]
MRILIVKMSSMGDVVHALPLATDLRAAQPDAEISWIVEHPFAAIPQLNPAVDRVIPIAWRRWRRRLAAAEVRAEMRAFYDDLTIEPFDLVLDCQGLIKSAVVARLAPAALRVGPAWAFAREPLAALAYGRRAIVPRDWHVVRRNRAIGAAACGYSIDTPPRFGLRVAPLTPAEAGWLPAGPIAVLVTGASRPQKLWPEPHWVAIAHRLLHAGLTPVWFWGSGDERARAERLAQSTDRALHSAPVSSGATSGTSSPAAPADAAPGAASVAAPGPAPDATAGTTAGTTAGAIPPFLSVADAARVLAGAAIVVGLDTGFTHLAGALGRPTIGIFCDFDATQCSVTGDGFCASFGGIGQVPQVSDVIGAIDRALASS